MVFGGTVLAHRIERAECALIEECTATLRRGSRDEAFLIPIAGGAAAFSGVESPLTKVVGLGFAGSPQEAELARIEAEFAARGATVQIELSTLAESGIAERLTERGYSLAGFENVLAAGGIALLCGAGTLPAHRRRGVQAAMLLRRLSAAAQAGCDLAVVTTLPGSKSQQNVQRLGFELLYSRAILRRSPAS